MKKSPVEFRPSLDVSLPQTKRGIGLRGPLLTPDGRALHNKPTIDLNEFLAEPHPVTQEVSLHVTDYHLPPLERIDLPYPLPRSTEDSPIALRHKPSIPGGQEPGGLQSRVPSPFGRGVFDIMNTTSSPTLTLPPGGGDFAILDGQEPVEHPEHRLSLFQDDTEFRDSLAKITKFSDWEPLRNLGEQIPPEKQLPSKTTEPTEVFDFPTRLFDDEESSHPIAPPDPSDRLSDAFDSLISSMPSPPPSAVVDPDISTLRIAHLPPPRRRTGPLFRRTVQRNVMVKKDEAPIAAEKITDEFVTPADDREHSLRVYEESFPQTPPIPGEVLLVADALTKSYYKSKLKIPVLKGVNFFVRDGEFVAIVGQSGSGKSTLLHLLGTLDNPESGTIHFDGLRIDNLSIARRDLLRNRSIGFIFQFYHLLPELTTLENVLSPLMIRESVFGYFTRRHGHIETAKRLLEQVGLSHRLNHKPSELSGGEMQRAAIARALVSEPRILLADEPTGNLDAQSAQETIDLLRALNREHRLTIVMVTHDHAVAQSADRIVRMIDGRIKI